MKIFQGLVCFLWRRTLLLRRLQPAKILFVAQKKQVYLRLFFVDRQRQMKNVVCEVIGVYPRKVLLKSSESFLPDVLCHERCSLHLMFPHATAAKYLGIREVALRHGFLCKCRVLHNSICPKTKDCIIEVTMPEKFIARDMQQYERVTPTALMLKEMNVWFVPGRLPRCPQNLGVPLFSCGEGQCSSLRLVNISAGGARVQIENVRCDGTPRTTLSKAVVLRIVLYRIMRKELPLVIVCNCVKVHYSRQVNILTLFLKFSQAWRESEFGDSCWVAVGREGVEEIEQWVVNDFCMLLDKKHPVSKVLCERFGLAKGR